eukprot:1142218-Rhodomonas_salina.1
MRYMYKQRIEGGVLPCSYQFCPYNAIGRNSAAGSSGRLLARYPGTRVQINMGEVDSITIRIC